MAASLWSYARSSITHGLTLRFPGMGPVDRTKLILERAVADTGVNRNVAVTRG